jgi:hypothetical protein
MGDLSTREYGETKSHPVIIEGVRRYQINQAVRELVSTGASRTDAINALAEALSGSIATLGFPVGMGIGLPDELSKRAAAKFMDRVFIGILHVAKEQSKREDEARTEAMDATQPNQGGAS